MHGLLHQLSRVGEFKIDFIAVQRFKIQIKQFQCGINMDCFLEKSDLYLLVNHKICFQASSSQSQTFFSETKKKEKQKQKELHEFTFTLNFQRYFLLHRINTPFAKEY